LKGVLTIISANCFLRALQILFIYLDLIKKLLFFWKFRRKQVILKALIKYERSEGYA